MGPIFREVAYQPTIVYLQLRTNHWLPTSAYLPLAIYRVFLLTGAPLKITSMEKKLKYLNWHPPKSSKF